MPTVTSKKNQALLKQYPFLQEIFDQATAQFSDVETTLRVVVKRADANMLYMTGDNSWDERRSIRSADHPDMQGKRLECFYPVNTAGELGERRHWDDGQSAEAYFVRNALNQRIYDWRDTHRGEDPREVIEYVAWVTLEHWYNDGDHYVIGAERPDKREIQITLYRKPKQGWKRLIAYSDVSGNVHLSGESLLPGIGYNDPHYKLLSSKAQSMAMRFELEVADQGLSALIDTSQKRGMSGALGTVTVRSLVFAGRVMITLERGHVSFTVAGVDDFNDMRLGAHTICGTLDEVGAMIADAAKFWQTLDESERSKVYQDDEKIRIL